VYAVGDVATAVSEAASKNSLQQTQVRAVKSVCHSVVIAQKVTCASYSAQGRTGGHGTSVTVITEQGQKRAAAKTTAYMVPSVMKLLIYLLT
jgi:hypothetical protein